MRSIRDAVFLLGGGHKIYTKILLKAFSEPKVTHHGEAVSLCCPLISTDFPCAVPASALVFRVTDL